MTKNGAPDLGALNKLFYNFGENLLYQYAKGAEETEGINVLLCMHSIDSLGFEINNAMSYSPTLFFVEFATNEHYLFAIEDDFGYVDIAFKRLHSMLMSDLIAVLNDVCGPDWPGKLELSTRTPWPCKQPRKTNTYTKIK